MLPKIYRAEAAYFLYGLHSEIITENDVKNGLIQLLKPAIIRLLKLLRWQ